MELARRPGTSACHTLPAVPALLPCGGGGDGGGGRWKRVPGWWAEGVRRGVGSSKVETGSTCGTRHYLPGLDFNLVLEQ